MSPLLQRESTLAVLLGAQSWTIPEVESSPAFKRSAEKIKNYLLSPAHLALPQRYLLDLFDDDRSGPHQVVDVGRWINQQIHAAKESGTEILDLFLYYIGHGSFLDVTQDYYLLVRCTDREYARETGILVSGLADCLRRQARHLRRFVILDCCYAGAAGKIFQSSRLDAAVAQTKQVMPRRGTVLLCSSSGERPSFVAPDGSLTMFSGALHRALVQGDKDAQMFLTFQDVSEMAWTVLRDSNENIAVRPFCYAPDQTEGDLSRLPAFPNPARQELKPELGKIVRDMKLAASVAELRSLKEIIDIYIREHPNDSDALSISNRISDTLSYEDERELKQKEVTARLIGWPAKGRTRHWYVAGAALFLLSVGLITLLFKLEQPDEPIGSGGTLTSSSVVAITRGDERVIYVSDPESGHVLAFLSSDLQTPFAKIPIGSHGAQTGRGTPENMIELRRSDLDIIFVVDTTADVLYLIDVNYNTVLRQSIKVGTTPRSMAITPDRRKLFVSNEQPIPNGSVFAIDVSSSQVKDFDVTAKFAGVNCPEGLAVSPSGELLYIASQCGGGQDPMFIVNTATYTRVGQVPGLPVGTSVAVSRDGQKVYVGRGNFSCNRSNPRESGSPFSVVDAKTRTIINTTCLHTSVGAIALSRDQRQRFLFIANGRNLSVFDRENLSLLNDIVLEADVGGIAIAEDNSVYAYIPGAHKLFVYSPSGLVSE
jgi:DNA-binding beta-propeller fold protein YncE